MESKKCIECKTNSVIREGITLCSRCLDKTDYSDLDVGTFTDYSESYPDTNVYVDLMKANVIIYRNSIEIIELNKAIVTLKKRLDDHNIPYFDSYSPLTKKPSEMGRDELVERNKEATARIEKHPRAKANPKDLIAHPSDYEEFYNNTAHNYTAPVLEFWKKFGKKNEDETNIPISE